MDIFRTSDVMFHQDNMSVCFIPLTWDPIFKVILGPSPYIPLLYSKLGLTGVYIIFLFLL